MPDNPDLWLNTGKQAVQLKPGTVYLLDFFTYGCINCLHVLPDIAFLEEKYGDFPFTVIGVHSGKFDQEKDAENVRMALLRHNLHHPVLLDNDYRVWQSYTVRAWPTLVLIDAQGYAIGTFSGEGNRERLDAVLGSLLDGQETHHQEGGYVLQEREPSALSFPGKVLADTVGDRLFIADTGHHRLVVVPLTDGGGYTQDYHYMGSGMPGFKDGSFETAEFRSPQGMALSPDGCTLFVADSGNHALRVIDLERQEVRTIAGTGRQCIGPLAEGAGRDTKLNSPWDLQLSPEAETLYVAMAGSHQIAQVEWESGSVRVWAGSGREGRSDGAAQEAAFAQPSGLASDRETLFVADAETSCIRGIDFGPDPQVTTLAGGDLFDFGYKDGSGDTARLQHPLGVTYDRTMDCLCIADTYNNRLRTLDVARGVVSTLAGNGNREMLHEPGGLSAAGGNLYIADTNNHRIRVARVTTGELTDFPLPGLCAPDRCFRREEEAATR